MAESVTVERPLRLAGVDPDRAYSAKEIKPLKETAERAEYDRLQNRCRRDVDRHREVNESDMDEGARSLERAQLAKIDLLAETTAARSAAGRGANSAQSEIWLGDPDLNRDCSGQSRVFYR